MTREDALQALQKIAATAEDDIESAHSKADDVLCNLLVSLGYTDIVAEYDSIPKWFA